MLSLILHLYQPSYQSKKVLAKVAEESYIPLVKFFKQNKDFNVTINIPLSLLELLDTYGYNSLLNDIQTLVQKGQVELTGSGAYHPLLPKVPQEVAEKEIILNEYGLGYYFGRKQGFEGEDAILISDVRGFFPPELALDEDILSLLDDLGYEWVVVDSASIPGGENVCGIYTVKDRNIKLVVRNTLVSNAIAFSRTDDFLFLESMLENNNDIIIALDGETFGHHNTYGIGFLHNLKDYTARKNIKTLKVSDLLSNTSHKQIENIRHATWACSAENYSIDHIYRLWENKDNKIQTLQWELLNVINNHYKDFNVNIDNDDTANIPLWSIEYMLEHVKNTEKHTEYVKYINYMKLQNSDQFWWSSNVEITNNMLLKDSNMISKALSLYEDFIESCSDVDVKSHLIDIVSKIRKENE